MLAPGAHGVGLALTFTPGRDLPPHLATDVRQLQQALLNLIGNAIKFTDEGLIDVRLTRAEARGAHRLRWEIADTGRGLGRAPDRLFDPFQHGDHPGVPGSGLGLAVREQRWRGWGARSGPTIGPEAEPCSGSISPPEQPVLGSIVSACRHSRRVAVGAPVWPAAATWLVAAITIARSRPMGQR